MKGQLVLVSALWFALVLYLDLPRIAALAGLLTAFVLYWWQGQKAKLERAEVECDDDEHAAESPVYWL